MKKRMFIGLIFLALLLLAALGTIISTGRRLMLSLAVAVPLSILPFASLMGTLLWMARRASAISRGSPGRWPTPSAARS